MYLVLKSPIPLLGGQVVPNEGGNDCADLCSTPDPVMFVLVDVGGIPVSAEWVDCDGHVTMTSCG